VQLLALLRQQRWLLVLVVLLVVLLVLVLVAAPGPGMSFASQASGAPQQAKPRIPCGLRVMVFANTGWQLQAKSSPVIFFFGQTTTARQSTGSNQDGTCQRTRMPSLKA
jgi:hypothetical protein